MIIKNFLTEEECLSLLIEAKTSEMWQPQNKDTGIFILKTKQHEMLKKINNRVASLFDSALHTQIIRMIHKTDRNSFWAEHSDNSGGKEIMFGVVIYLNDDFVGGELIYPKLDISVKPEKGMLVCHEGDEPHFVSKVHSGERYTLTSFIRKI